MKFGEIGGWDNFVNSSLNGVKSKILNAFLPLMMKV